MHAPMLGCNVGVLAIAYLKTEVKSQNPPFVSDRQLHPLLEDLPASADILHEMFSPKARPSDEDAGTQTQIFLQLQLQHEAERVVTFCCSQQPFQLQLAHLRWPRLLLHFQSSRVDKYPKIVIAAEGHHNIITA